MIVFFDPDTLNIHHVVIHAPEDYKASLEANGDLHWVEVDDDIPPEEIAITKDGKVFRQKKIFGSEEESIQINIEEHRSKATKIIDEKSHLDMEPYLIAQKYLWATSNPIERAIQKEAELLNMPLDQLISHIKHRNDEERVRLQWAELHRQKAKLDLSIATSVEQIDFIVNSFDPTVPIDGIFVVDTSSSSPSATGS